MDSINAFISYNSEEKSNKESGKLTGITVGVKDNICVKGMTTTCGSRMLQNFEPPYSATVVEKIIKEGGYIIGKTNMDEFAMGSSSTTSCYGAVRNPLNTEYITGGSSGGSAAAVAAGLCDMALGSDTGGSIRQPASFCGVVGLKPTYGTVSRYGLVSYGSSLEQIGPITGNVIDCARLLEVISAYDNKDSNSIRREKYDFTSDIKNSVKGMRIGLPVEYFTDDVEPEIRKTVMAAIELLKSKGAIVEECHIKYVEEATMVYYILACAQASSNLARFDGIKYGYRHKQYEDLNSLYENTRQAGFGDEVRKRIEFGEYVLSNDNYEDYYMQALKVNRLIKEEYDRLFTKYDALISPVTKCGAVKIDEKINSTKEFAYDLYLVPANLCGFPAMTVPFGKDEKGIGIGVQIMSQCFEEKKMLQIAYTLEQAER